MLRGRLVLAFAVAAIVYLVAGVASSVETPPVSIDERRQILSRLARSFVEVRVEAEADAPAKGQEDVVATKSGSGAVVATRDGRSYVLTNAHVVRLDPGWHLTKLVVVPVDGEETTAAVVKSGDDESLGDDLALLRAEAPIGVPIRIAPRPARWQSVFVLGSPMAQGPHGGEGTMDRPFVMSGRPYWRISAQILPGMSGGPVVDRFGRLVCVVSNGLRGGSIGAIAPGYGLCLGSERVRAFLRGRDAAR